MTDISKIDKDDFLDDLKRKFEDDWEMFEGFKTERIGRHTFASILDTIGRIKECEHKEQRYYELFKESGMWMMRPSFELYVPTITDNAVRDYNRLFEVLYHTFVDKNNNCQMIRLIAEDGMEFMDEYYISLMDLYSMDWRNFKDEIMRRSHNQRTMVGAEYKTLNTEDFWRLLQIIDDGANYEEEPLMKDGHFWMKRNVIKDFYETLKRRKDDKFNFKFKRMKHLKG